MMMKRLLIIAGILLAIGIATAYLPPVYIANYETGECQYYFAGDWTHHNPMPENGTWHMVGISGARIDKCPMDNGMANISKCMEENCAILCSYYSQEGFIWEGLDCACIGEGEESCINWCKIKDGEWSKDDSKCICPLGMEWDSSEERCIKGPGYDEALSSCSKEISNVITKLNRLEKDLNQSKRSAESTKEEFAKIRDEFSKLKEENTQDSLQESIDNLERMLADFEFRIQEPGSQAIDTVSNLKEELSGFGKGERITTIPEPVETTIPAKVSENNELILWIGLILVVLITVIGVVYITKK